MYMKSTLETLVCIIYFKTTGYIMLTVLLLNNYRPAILLV